MDYCRIITDEKCLFSVDPGLFVMKSCGIHLICAVKQIILSILADGEIVFAIIIGF